MSLMTILKTVRPILVQIAAFPFLVVLLALYFVADFATGLAERTCHR